MPVLSSRYPGFTKYVPAVKKAGEEICFLYAKDYGLSVGIVRPARVYGPLGHDTSPIAIMVRSAVARKPADLTHVGGEDKGNYVYAPDAAKGIALVHLAEAPKHNIYNVGETEHDLSEFAQVVREVIPDAEIRLGMGKPERTTVRAPLDITRIKEETGYVPNYDLKRGIRSYINWVRDGQYEIDKI